MYKLLVFSNLEQYSGNSFDSAVAKLLKKAYIMFHQTFAKSFENVVLICLKCGA